MLLQNAQAVTRYSMHRCIEVAYGRVHDWFNTDSEMKLYHSYNWDEHSQLVLARENPTQAAFNFHLYFPTHFFKVSHALQSDRIIGFAKLLDWLRYNPYITVVDVGCGDGADHRSASLRGHRTQEGKCRHYAVTWALYNALMPAPTLATKLYVPPPRPNAVPRPRLIARLNEGLQAGRKLALISAPAGFGKTTLASEWISTLTPCPLSHKARGDCVVVAG